MPVVYLGLGSNLGQSENIIASALTSLSECSGLNVKSCAPFYRSKPLESKKQPDYLNTVACLYCEYSALDLLNKLQLIEEHFGRQRNDERWASRTLDIDILLYDDVRMSNSRLTIPHAGLLQRDFVLYPLYEIAPEIEIPGFGPILSALQACENRGLEKLNEYHWQP